MPAKVVELEDIGTLHLYKRHGSRSIRMSFDNNGNLRISLPYWVPYKAALDFALQRKSWIEKHRPEPKAHFKQGERIGKAHRLNFIADTSVKTAHVRLTTGQIVIKHPAAMSETSSKVQAAADRGAKKALQKEAETLLPQRLHALADTHGFRFRTVTVKQLKTKWGSCDQNRQITLNYYLMQLPWQLIDYVLLHELTHTEHLNHGEAFWERFEEVLPGAKQIRKQLKSYKTFVVQSS